MKRGGRRVGLKKTTVPKPSTPKRSRESSPECSPNRAASTPKRKKVSTPNKVRTPRVDTPESGGCQSPHLSKKWTLERERRLCEMWEEEAHLYDATSKDYRNTNKRQRALQRFSAILKLEGKW